MLKENQKIDLIQVSIQTDFLSLDLIVIQYLKVKFPSYFHWIVI